MGWAVDEVEHDLGHAQCSSNGVGNCDEQIVVDDASHEPQSTVEADSCAHEHGDRGRRLGHDHLLDPLERRKVKKEVRGVGEIPEHVSKLIVALMDHVRLDQHKIRCDDHKDEETDSCCLRDVSAVLAPSGVDDKVHDRHDLTDSRHNEQREDVVGRVRVCQPSQS